MWRKEKTLILESHIFVFLQTDTKQTKDSHLPLHIPKQRGIFRAIIFEAEAEAEAEVEAGAEAEAAAGGIQWRPSLH